MKLKIISSKGEKKIIEKYNYKKPNTKPIGYKPKIGNRK
jgi:hypothetical protein